MKKQTIIAFILCFMFLNDAAAQKFIVSYTTQAHAGPFSGNIILYLAKNKKEPKNHLSWPCYRLNVKNISPGEAVVFSDSCLSYPTYCRGSAAANITYRLYGI